MKQLLRARNKSAISALISTRFFDWLPLGVRKGFLKSLKVGTHEGTSPCDWSLRLVPCSVYTKEIVAGESPLKKNKFRAL